MVSVSPPTAKLSGFILGFGLGGSLDGIVLHQILQWHSMASAVVPPTTMQAMKRNMAWDGMFQAACWILILIGICLLFGDARKRRFGEILPGRRTFAGLLVAGWGVFNLVEGIVDHHILGLHHVRDMPVHIVSYDWLFLGIGGVGFLLLGWALMRPPKPQSTQNGLYRGGVSINDR
jgi:uncharacterized membrane protein